MDSGKVILGVLAGVAAGAILGLLFAPDKGSNTRQNISKKGEEYAEDLKVKFSEFIDNIIKHDHQTKEDRTEFYEKSRSEATS